MKNIFFIFIFSIQFSVFANEWSELTTFKDIKIYAQAKTTTGIIPFKAIYTVEIEQEKLVMALFNHQSKPSWAPKLKSVKMHKDLNPSEFIFSEYYTTPWPFYDREFLLKGKAYRKGNTVWLKASSLKDENLKDDDHVQADVQMIEVAITKIAPKKTQLSFAFIGDMGGMIPTWVINLIQKKWPAKFLLGLEAFSKSGKNLPTTDYLKWRKYISK